MWTVEQTEQHLVEIASQGTLVVFYGDLYLLAGVDSENDDSRSEFHDILGEVSARHHSKGYPMLSVIVVKNDNNQRPGPGFFELARQLNPKYKKSDNETIYITEIVQVEKHADAYRDLLQDLRLQKYHLTEEDRTVIAQTMELTFREGGKVLVSSYQYERDPRARQACIESYGFCCSVCKFNFAQTFGEIGEGFIHVHHLNPLSQQEGEHETKAIRDLRPVCPNCHAMLHKRTPPYSIEELKEILQKTANNRKLE